MNRAVDNSIYDALDERWYTAKDDPVALLRAESACRTPWIVERIEAHFAVRGRPPRVLDVGCGAGFLSNALARRGYHVTGIDASANSLRVAARHDEGGRVRYAVADAMRLPFGDGEFDVVCAMDVLEHVTEPAAVVAEAARVLAPGGQFFFYTFDRSWLAWLVVIKGVEWFVANTPPGLHVIDLFLRPSELRAMCDASGLRVHELRGFAPAIASRAFWRLLWTGTVADDFRFRFTSSTRVAYIGYALRAG